MQVRGRFAGLAIGAAGLLFPTANLVHGEGFASPPVAITLKAPWAAPPLLLEILELIPRFNASGYFHALDRLTSPDFNVNKKPLAIAKDQLVYERALEFVFDELVASESRQLFELYLSLHNTAPAVQAYYQFYNDTVIPELSALGANFDPTCRNWIHFKDQQYCDLDVFKKFLTELSSSDYSKE